MSSFDLAFEQVKKLVENFSANEKMYLATDYSEARARTDFIDKFFNTLGWDVYHNEQLNPYEQEVSIEKSVNVEGRQQKRADYAFFLAPNYRKDDVKFYVEAKKPSKNLSNQVDYFQTCRYGWSAGTPLAILTDFEELHILDCRTRPDITTILNNKREHFYYKDYLDKEKFAKLYWLFSREAIANNSLEKYVEQLPKPRGKGVQKKGGYQSIDEVFLEELDEIRTTLAKAFKKNNPHLGSDELTEMTQRTIDRLVFIRFLEDKQIEPEHYVSEFGDSKTAWKDFIYASRKLNAKYNGIVFKKSFIDEKNFVEPNDSDFAPVCEELSHVNSPYNFDLIPIHILGSIYERFLGKVVIATDKRVRIDEKPEVRKAGGVYYTPQYIVNYIVENTIGKLIGGKTPKEIAKLRFADISCGSGSFLITVFDKLLEYHKKWYQNNPKEAKSAGCYEVDGKWVLSLKQKQKILINNIYGVDIDAQAVEVTQLSLYLKLLEDESNATAEETWVMFKEQILPSLSDNIICGNSLIGTDISSSTLFNWEEEKKLKPMNFEDAFPKIMKDGGFDAIVGNPPYLTYSLGKGQDAQTKIFLSYLIQTYPNSSEYKLNSFAIFYERALELINKMGIVAYIVPGTILINENLSKIRKFILDNYSIKEIVSLKYKVFSSAEMGDTAILFVYRQIITNEFVLIEYHDKSWQLNDNISTIKYDMINKVPDKRFIKPSFMNRFFEDSNFEALNNHALFYNGIKTGDNKKFLSDKKLTGKHFLAIRGRDFERYLEPSPKTYVLFDKKQLWSNFDESKLCVKNKIIIRQTSDRLMATIEDKGILCMDTVHIIYKADLDIQLLLGLINSSLFNYFHKILVPETGKAFAEVKIANLKKLIIPLVNESNNEMANLIIHRVIQMLESKKQLATAKTDNEKEYLEKKCKGLDRQIDALVYELYGLTEEEIKIVEKNLDN